MADDDAILRSTKASLDKLFSGLNASAGATTKSFNNLSNSALLTAGQLRAFGGLISSTGSQSKSAGKSFDATAQYVAAAGASFSEVSKRLQQDAYKISRELDTVTANLKETGDDGGGVLEGFAGKITKAASVIPGLGKAAGLVMGALGGLGFTMGAVTDTAKAAYQGWRESSKAGASFGASMVDYSKMVSASQLQFEEFNAIVRNGAQGMSIFAGTVNAGAMRFASVMAQLQDFEMGMKQNVRESMSYVEITRALGLNTQDVGELMSDMMQNTAMAVNYRNMSDTELANATASYIGQMHRLSVITGKNIKEQSEQAKKLALDKQFQAKLSMVEDPKEREAMMAAYQQAVAVGGDKMGDLFKAGVVGSFANLGTEARQLASTTAGNAFIELGNEVSQAGTEAANVIRNRLPELKDSIEATNKALAPLAAMGADVGLLAFGETFDIMTKFDSMVKDAQTRLGMQGDDIVKAYDLIYEDILKTKTDGEGNIISIGDETTKAVNNVVQSIQSLQFGALNTAINGFDGMMESLAGTLNDVTTSLGIGFGMELMTPEERDRLTKLNAAARGGYTEETTDEYGRVRNVRNHRQPGSGHDPMDTMHMTNVGRAFQSASDLFDDFFGDIYSWFKGEEASAMSAEFSEKVKERTKTYMGHMSSYADEYGNKTSLQYRSGADTQKMIAALQKTPGTTYQEMGRLESLGVNTQVEELKFSNIDQATKMLTESEKQTQLLTEIKNQLQRSGDKTVVATNGNSTIVASGYANEAGQDAMVYGSA